MFAQFSLIGSHGIASGRVASCECRHRRLSDNVSAFTATPFQPSSMRACQNSVVPRGQFMECLELEHEIDQPLLALPRYVPGPTSRISSRIQWARSDVSE